MKLVQIEKSLFEGLVKGLNEVDNFGKPCKIVMVPFGEELPPNEEFRGYCCIAIEAGK